jgi:hypothetical protein
VLQRADHTEKIEVPGIIARCTAPRHRASRGKMPDELPSEFALPSEKKVRSTNRDALSTRRRSRRIVHGTVVRGPDLVDSRGGGFLRLDLPMA